jgi:hypothetical protein
MSDVSTHPAFQQPPDTSILAWRYMDLPKLLALIIKRELYLRRLDLLPDKFEGLYPTQTSKALTQAYLASGQIDADTAKGIAEHRVKFAKDVRRNFYVNCWHLGDVESEAMWRIYCGAGGGVAIVLPYEKLSASIDSARNQAIGSRIRREGQSIVDGQRARMNQRGRVLCPLNEATSTRRCDTCSTRACSSRDCRAPRHARFATFSIWRSGDSRPATFMLATRRPRSRRYAP